MQNRQTRQASMQLCHVTAETGGVTLLSLLIGRATRDVALPDHRHSIPMAALGDTL